MWLYHQLIEPFVAFGFMRRALIGCLALSLSYGPIGVLLVLRRMSLMGDALSHAILPGAALGYLIAGLSLPAMSLGGLIAGVVVALAAGAVSRLTALREDASLAGFYLISLALGVLILSARGSPIDLMHVLFGTLLSIDGAALVQIAGVASVSLLVLAAILRPLVAECFDPGFLRSVGGNGAIYHVVFLVLVVLNLVAGFNALGTLMAVGLMMLPAASARLWAEDIAHLMLIACGLAFASAAVGLLVSFHLGTASGPSVVLTAGVAYLVSVLTGTRGGVVWRFVHLPHHHEAPDRPHEGHKAA